MYTCHGVRVRYKKGEYVPIQYAGAFNKYSESYSSDCSLCGNFIWVYNC